MSLGLQSCRHLALNPPSYSDHAVHYDQQDLLGTERGLFFNGRSPSAIWMSVRQMPKYADRKFLVRVFDPGSPAKLDSHRHITPDSLPTVPSRPGYDRLTLPAADTPQNVQYLPHAGLPICRTAHASELGCA